MSKKSFNSFNIGNVAEEFVCATFNEHGLCCIKDTNRENIYKHDLVVSDGELKKTIEVKYDIMAARTKNICIEYWNSKKDAPSGITATTSDFWCIVIPNKEKRELWLAPTEAIRVFIANLRPHKIVESGGDNNSNMYLYRRDVILPGIFYDVNELTTEELREIIYENT